jgi:hypothetical protein
MAAGLGSPGATVPQEAARVALEEFVEMATRAALRALDERGAGAQVTARAAQPSAPAAAGLPGVRIIIGIILGSNPPE